MRNGRIKYMPNKIPYCTFNDCLYYHDPDEFYRCEKCVHHIDNLELKNNYIGTGNTNYNLICLSGKVGSGKDTVAEYLYYNYDFAGYSFADELKKLAREGGWDGEKDLKGRKLLQQLGLTFRNYCPIHWIDRLIKSNYKFNTEIANGRMYKNICLVDCRHLNEITDFSKRFYRYYPDFILKKQLTICVIGPNRDSTREMDEETKNDISENSLNDYKFNYTIHNNGTLEDMYSVVDEIMLKEFPEIKCKNHYKFKR